MDQALNQIIKVSYFILNYGFQKEVQKIFYED